MYKIILDTNFLINAIKFKLDIFSELKKTLDNPFKVYIVDKTLDELKSKPNERLIRTFIERKGINIIKTAKNKYTDDLILEKSTENTVIATQDKELKEKAKKKGLKTLIIRQKKYLLMI